MAKVHGGTLRSGQLRLIRPKSMFLFILMVWMKTVHAFPGIVLDCNNVTSVKYTSNCIGGHVFHCLPMKNRSLIIFCASPEIQSDKVCPYAFFDEEGKWEIKYTECIGSEDDCPGETNKLSSTEPQKFEGCNKLFQIRNPRTTQNSVSRNSKIAGTDISSTIVNDYTTNTTKMVYHVSLQNSIIIIISGIIGFVVICIIIMTIYWIVRRRHQNLPKQTLTVETRHSSNSQDYPASNPVVVEVQESRNNMIDIDYDDYGFCKEQDNFYDICK